MESIKSCAETPKLSARSPSFKVEGFTLVADPSGLHALSMETGEVTNYFIPWCDLATVRWDGKELEVQLLNPVSDKLRFQSDLSPDWNFMDTVRDSITRAIVISASEQLANGTMISASVRRGLDGKLFSVVTAYGPVNNSEVKAMSRLEYTVREAAGLPNELWEC